MDYSEIKIRLDGINFNNAERYRVIIHKLITCGALDVKTGQTVLHWKDNELMEIKAGLTLFSKEL